MQINFFKDTLIRVRYGETDQMGYCYYGNYAQYFEVGRVEALRSCGLSYKEMEQNGVMLPVSDFHVKYLSPAFYDDLLRVRTKIISIDRARIYFEYEVFNEADKLLSTATTTLVFVNKETMRPSSPPVSFLELMHKYEILN